MTLSEAKQWFGGCETVVEWCFKWNNDYDSNKLNIENKQMDWTNKKMNVLLRNEHRGTNIEGARDCNPNNFYFYLKKKCVFIWKFFLKKN